MTISYVCHRSYKLFVFVYIVQICKYSGCLFAVPCLHSFTKVLLFLTFLSLCMRSVLVYVHPKVGTQIFFCKSEIANPQILGLIPQSQIRKFLRCASPQMRKFVTINPQIAKIYCLKKLSPQICGFAICPTYLRTAHYSLAVHYA
jgi:hypothetical protein